MIKVTSFYKFFPIAKKSLPDFKKKLEDKGQTLRVRGLILVGEEGINATISGEIQNLKKYKIYLTGLFKQNFIYKNSYCDKWNFKRLSIKIKKEIVNIGKTYSHLKEENNHLTPEEWKNKMNEIPQIIDTRNDYEVRIGKFKQAINLQMESFKNFPKKIENLNLNKKKDTLIYCTGGIRCEKAIEIMKDKGFKNVYQLKGGILNYLQRYPNFQFEGECFVFDHRVSLDQKLHPSKKYSSCPHCGQPGDVFINCSHCYKEAKVCSICLEKHPHYKTCSKNCAYHFKSGHKCHIKLIKKEVLSKK